MRHVLQIARRELASYFLSSIAYISLVVFYIAFGIIFHLYVTYPYAVASMEGPFHLTTLILALVVPVLTMRLLAEERRLGTIEGLMTAPVTHTAVVVGKYLGALVFYIILLVPTALHAWVLFHYSTAGPDAWKLASCYLGLVVLGCFMLSFGLFCSSLTRSQVVAAMAGVSLLFLFWLLSYFLPDTPPATLTQSMREDVLKGLYKAAKFMAYRGHFDSFATGALDLRDIIFFGSFTIFFLFLSVVALANRKWR